MTPEERWARIEQRHEALAAGLELLAISHQATERTLRWAFRVCVHDHRQERRRRQELLARFDEKMTQLAAAQLVTEEKLQRLENTVERFLNGSRGNGNPPRG